LKNHPATTFKSPWREKEEEKEEEEDLIEETPPATNSCCRVRVFLFEKRIFVIYL
jgi:hypothetical protein